MRYTPTFHCCPFTIPTVWLDCAYAYGILLEINMSLPVVLLPVVLLPVVLKACLTILKCASSLLVNTVHLAVGVTEKTLNYFSIQRKRRQQRDGGVGVAVISPQPRESHVTFELTADRIMFATRLTVRVQQGLE